MTKRSNSVNFPEMGVKSNNQPLMLIDSKRRNYRARDFPSYSTVFIIYDRCTTCQTISTVPTILINTVSQKCSKTSFW